MKNKVNPVWYIVIALTIWCVWNSVSNSGFISKLDDIRTGQQVVAREVAHLMDRLNALELVEPKVIIKEVEVPAEDVLDILKEGE